MRNTFKTSPIVKKVFNTFGITVFLLHSLQLMETQSQNDDLYISNLTPQCLHCLCIAASNCNLTFGCQKGYCGPYKISRVYWADTGPQVLPGDDPERAGAYEDCARNYHCAQTMVRKYLARYGKDCNNDGVTDCMDFSMINFNGGFQWTASLTITEASRNYTQRYAKCSPTL